MIKVLFMGRKKVAARCLERLLASEIFSVIAVLTDSHLDVSPTSDVARKAGLPLLTYEAALEKLEKNDLQYDLGVSMLYWRKLKSAFLTHPRYGTINFHPAPLPEYKGVGGYNLAILDCLDKWAVSAHYVDESIDTGPIIKINRFPICQNTETAKSLEKKSQVALEMIFDDVMDIISAEPELITTTPNVGGRHLSRSQLERMKLIDMQNDDVERKIRAFWFPPYDGAYVEAKGEKFTLVSRGILEDLADPEISSLFTPPSR